MHDCAYTLRETPFWWFEQPLADKVQLWLETNLIHAPQHGIYRSDQLWVMISLFYLEFVKLIEAGEIFWVHADPHFGIGTNIARAAQSQQWWSMCQLERLGSAFRDYLAKIKPDWSPTSNTIRSSLGECFVNSSTSLNFFASSIRTCMRTTELIFNGSQQWLTSAAANQMVLTLSKSHFFWLFKHSQIWRWG